MNYEDAVNYYVSSPKFLSTISNEPLLKLLDYLGNPQNALSFIHIAGTNGKGSVCAMLSECLKLKYKTGLFTSPFIEVFNERIKINGQNITNYDLAKYTEIVKNAIEQLELQLPSFSKIMATAMLYFAHEKCDIVILETGLGGRLDATNIVTPIMSVITKIGYDHTEYLGDTLSKIATEKSGIIKPKIPVVTTINQENEALDVIKAFAKQNNSKLLIADINEEHELSLNGEYQKENSGIAFTILKNLNIDDELIKIGFKNTTWPARFEFINKNLLLDGAHNPDGILALLKSLQKLQRPVHFVLAMMKDKNYKESAKMISDFGGKVTITQIDMPRCLSAEELAKEFPNAIIIKNPIEAVSKATTSITGNELVCVLGSLYFTGEIRKNFRV